MAHATFARFGRQPHGVDRLSGDAARQGSGVRSFGRSGFASEVRPCLSCCTERAYEVTSSRGIWKQRRLPVPPAAPMDHAPWCGGRVAPSPGTRAAINGVSISRVGWIWAKTDLADFYSKRIVHRKNKRAPLMRFHIGFAVSKNPQGNELPRLPQSPFMSVRGPPYTFEHRPYLSGFT